MVRLSKDEIPETCFRSFDIRKETRHMFGSRVTRRNRNGKLEAVRAYRCKHCNDTHELGLSGEIAATVDDLYVGALARGWSFSWTGQQCGKCNKSLFNRIKFKVKSSLVHPYSFVTAVVLYSWTLGVILVTLFITITIWILQYV